MDVILPSAGSYVVAVSGGVDSMALLHILQRQSDLKLTIAHFDHGIRDNSAEDRQLVQKVAKNYGLPFVYHEGRLGAGASEATARQVRYEFLHDVRRASQARAIITAHHQDDVLETAIINILRGSGRKGLTALRSRDDVKRPLLAVPKNELIDYARDQGLVWHEDSTNQNTAHLRNYVRHKILPRFSDQDRAGLVNILTKLEVTNEELDDMLTNLRQTQAAQNRLNREWFGYLPHPVAREVMADWLRFHGVRTFDRKTLERLVVAAKTASPGKTFPVLAGCTMEVAANDLALAGAER